MKPQACSWLCQEAAFPTFTAPKAVVFCHNALWIKKFCHWTPILLSLLFQAPSSPTPRFLTYTQKGDGQPISRHNPNVSGEIRRKLQPPPSAVKDRQRELAAVRKDLPRERLHSASENSSPEVGGLVPFWLCWADGSRCEACVYQPATFLAYAGPGGSTIT
ncbi:hypothetical protein K431DRAFT_304694 [Polychaeton citri CBS 116435]|uniref:Uncharacterized protein n=1 Tax=Polychaeton citri CBS 116435 TaxID=1314669 RepID=A0A9P4Q3Q6_9PEZI|nr:hypothetical protein K431DRAFT_304694 [Polychaeton citri CBS 116435]